MYAGVGTNHTRGRVGAAGGGRWSCGDESSLPDRGDTVGVEHHIRTQDRHAFGKGFDAGYEGRRLTRAVEEREMRVEMKVSEFGHE